MKLIGKYKNGNYQVALFDDGTKIRQNDLEFFEPEFAECIDISISERCRNGCEFCYLGCTEDGKEADFTNMALLDSFKPYTEVALNLNSEIPDGLENWLRALKERKVIANVTIHQKQFLINIFLLKRWQDEGLIHGVGVSIDKPMGQFFTYADYLDDVVVHVVNGVIEHEDFDKLADHNLRVLILGYKHKGRGVEYDDIFVESRKAAMFSYISHYLNRFKVLSFDNLALEQLDIEGLCMVENLPWDELYMGADGDYTFYLDLVNEEFGPSSTSDVRWPMTNDVVEMFNRVREA